MMKRILGLFLAVCLIVGIIPISASAADGGGGLGGLDGVITENTNNISLTVSGLAVLPYLGGWEVASDIQHNSSPVLSGSGMMATLAITPSEPCYFVFDYIFVGTVASNTRFSFCASNSTSSIAAIATAYTAHENSELSEDKWSTGVVDCTVEGYQNAIFDLMDMTSSNAKAYISNIRICKELPDEYKAYVTINYSNNHGTLSGAISKNGQQTQQVNLSGVSSGVAFDLPLDSVLYQANFAPVDGASFNGFKIKTPSNQEQTFERFYTDDNTNKQIFYFTEPGNYTIDVLSGKAADEAEMKVSHSTDGSEWTQETTTYKADYGDLYVEPYGSNQKWKIEFTKGEKKYDSIAVKDNGAAVSLTNGDDGVSYYELTPGTDIHQIDIVYKQADCSDVEKHLVIWPTLDFMRVYGGDGKNAGMTDDFWKTDDSGKLSKRNGVDAKNGTTGTYNFLYDPTSDSGAGMDAKHPVIFSSRLRSRASSATTINTFTFSKAGLFSFDYMVYNGEGNEYDDSMYTFTVRKNNATVASQNSGISGWQHVEVVVDTSDTVSIMFIDPENVGTWAGISNISFLSDTVTLTVNHTGNGTVKGANDTGQYYKGQTVTLEASPDAGNAFTGWYKDDQLLSTDSVLPYACEETSTITAKFYTYGENIAQIGDKFYPTLDAAFSAAGTMGSDRVVRLLGTEYVLESDLTVPAGVTLLLPCSNIDTGYSPITGFNPDDTILRENASTGGIGKNAKKYFTLTIPADKTLTVNGTVLVNAVTGRPHAGYYDQDVTGGYAEITLDGSIVVKNGGVLDVCGYVKSSASGSGTITAEDGGEVRDLYVVRKFRGGSQAFHIFPYIYPMNEVDMHNIEVKTVINAGAKFVGTVKMYASNSYHYTRFPQVDRVNGLIRQETGTVTRTYDTDTKRETWVLDGTGIISSSILNIVGMDMSTGTFLYPIDGDMDFVVKGNWNVVERLKFMPGAKVDLTEGALTLAERTVREPRDNEILFYDGTYNEDHIQHTVTNTKYPTGRGDALLTLHGGTTTNVNCAFGGKIAVDKDATEETPAVIKFMEGKAVSVTSHESSDYLATPYYKEWTVTATLGGYQVESGKTYKCYYEGETLVIEPAGDGTTQDAVYNGQTVAWNGAQDKSVEYKTGEKWSADAPKNAGTYAVRQVESESGYKVVKALGTLTINQLPVQITWTDPDALVYDGSEKTVTATVGNKAGDDDVTVTVDKPSGTTVGEYTSTVTALGGAAADNYTLDGGENLTHTWNISAAQRTEKPTVSADTPTGIKDKVTITVTGIDSVTVEYSTAEDGTYTDLAGTTLEAEQDTTYYFRYKADANYTAGPTESVKTGKFDAPAEATPDISIDYGTEQLTGFGEGKYTVNGNEVTAQDGKAAISEDWFGKTLEIVKKGDEETTFDSAAQSLEIPARPEAPTATPNKETHSGGGGSVKVEVEDGKAYEYKKDDGAEWADVPTGGEIKDLSAGKYEVRVKATENSFAGIVGVAEVEKYTPQSSGGSPGGSPGSSTPPANKTETVTNPDGSTTTTTTKSDGSKTETTKQTDGTVSEKVTKKDGSTTETTTMPSGMTGKVETDANGDVKSAEAVVPAKAETDERGVVTLPIEVPALTDAKEAPEISVSVKGSDPARVECPVTEFGPGTVAVLVHEDGTEEVVRDCVMGENGVILNVEGDVTLKIVDNTRTFSDVEPVDHWATDAVEFVAARELFNGTGDGKFTPGGDMTRGMLVTVLYRLNYEPEAVSGGFADIDANAYYADAVAWAQDAGVVSGYGNGQFGPNDDVTREQIVTILYRYAEKNGYLAGHTGTLAGYADAGKVSGYAMEAMSWAVNTGLVRGVDDTHLAPTNNATRAEVATILMRFCEQMMG